MEQTKTQQPSYVAKVDALLNKIDKKEVDFPTAAIYLFQLRDQIQAMEYILNQTVLSHTLQFILKDAIASPNYTGVAGWFDRWPFKAKCGKPGTRYIDSLYPYTDPAVTCFGFKPQDEQKAKEKALVTPRDALDDMIQILEMRSTFFTFMNRFLRKNNRAVIVSTDKLCRIEDIL